MVGRRPKAYWYLSRGSAFAALGLLWLSMMLGLLITIGLTLLPARRGPPLRSMNI